MVWKLRHTLKSNPRMLHKMFVSCTWESEEAVSSAFNLLGQWEKFELDNAFTLLSAQYSCNELYTDRCFLVNMNDKCKEDLRKIRLFALRYIM